MNSSTSLSNLYLSVVVRVLCVCVPVHEAFTLQICQRCAELVGKQNERGQIQTVLPHLKKRAQLCTERHGDEARPEKRSSREATWGGTHSTRTSPRVQSSMMIHTGFSVITPISLTMWGWSNWRIVTAGEANTTTQTHSAQIEKVAVLLMSVNPRG